jgi:predicted phage-related endonuclease
MEEQEMSIIDMDSKIKELRELRRMADELTAEMESITDSIKRHMDAEGVDTLNGTDWKVTYKAVTSSRLDTTALKKALPDLTAQFTKTTTARRFCIA